MASVDNGGVSIYYEVLGDGPALILQHGFTQSTARWHIDGYVEALKEDYRLVLIDARGHGKSDKPYDPRAYAPELMADDVVAVMDALAIEKSAYWGFSMGAMIGFDLANAVPERFTAFVLGGMHPYGRTIPPDAKSDGADPQEFADTFMRRIGIDPATMPAKYRSLMLDNDFRALAAVQQDRPSQAAAIAKMTMPCLMFAGGADPMHDKAKHAASQIANCRFFTVGKLDHGATFRESGRLLPEVRAFLAMI